MISFSSFNKEELGQLLKEKSPKKLNSLAENYLMELGGILDEENNVALAAFIASAAAFLQARAIYFMLQEMQPRETEI